MRILGTALIAILLSNCGQKKNEKLFRSLDAEASGIGFANNITINDTINILENEFTYNGAGVAVGDLNGDGLQDIYFCGNQVPNKLYINKGGMKFEDVTDQSGAQKKKGQWSSGVTMLDINSDGKLDIYVCNTLLGDSINLRDLLFINQGNNEKGIPMFREMAVDYGITDDTHNSISTFFDYDLDGDLDLFVSVNFIDMQYPNQYITKMPDGSALTRDKLFRNDFDSSKGHAVFTDVSMQAGIVWGGYSHSCLIHDFNGDQWPDIYVANDYLSNDLIYINNKNGTFTNRIAEMFKHQSYSSMGSDIADINNDGYDDLFTVEMLPVDNKRKKVNMGANNYTHYLFTEQYKYEYQFVRNTFQLYRGLNPHTGLPIYSDIAFLAGVEATDWSWSPLLADFDNDGYRDLLITNGFPKDIIDHDFGAFRSSINSSLISRQELYDMIPEVKIPNFIFRNNQDLRFTDVSKEWGIDLPSFTNGTAYADLDNDGDLDIVTNNINDPAFLLQNTLNDRSEKEKKPNFLKISLQGPAANPLGFGARVTIWTGGRMQVAESHCVRGYLSKSESDLHFGLGDAASVDSLQVVWADGKTQKLGTQAAGKKITLQYKEAAAQPFIVPTKKQTLLEETDPLQFGIDYVHEENDFIDFNLQKTLPHKFSQYGPAIAVADVNGDSLDDMLLGSTGRFQGPILLTQGANGKFKKTVLNLKLEEPYKEEDMGVLLFDADGDKDNDLYVVRGSYQHDAGSVLYQDLICENDGKGNFRIVKEGLPAITASGQNVKAADIDGDGDLDLFVGGRVEPKAYPKPGQSFLLRNDSKPGQLKFTDVTAAWNPGLSNIGMVSDALFTDMDGDNKPDLLLACEWSPLVFLRNTGKSFDRADPGKEINDAMGWWNSLVSGDFDGDGDMDYAAGNFGLNQYFKCSSSEPLRIYGKDFDQNGSYDSFISCYFPDSTGKRHEYFFHTKDDMQKQLILIRKKFEKYADFGRATVKDVFNADEMKDVRVLTANYMRTAWIENKGGMKFTLHELPIEAQMAPVYGMATTDLNADGFVDLMMIGNDFGMETGQGRADAFNGLVLLNQAGKGFRAVDFPESGLFVPGDARAMAFAQISQATYLVATQNRRKLSLFRLPASFTVKVGEGEVAAMVRAGKGKYKVEFQKGSSFLSQSSRNWYAPPNTVSIEMLDGNGRVTRTISKPTNN